MSEHVGLVIDGNCQGASALHSVSSKSSACWIQQTCVFQNMCGETWFLYTVVGVVTLRSDGAKDSFPVYTIWWLRGSQNQVFHLRKRVPTSPGQEGLWSNKHFFISMLFLFFKLNLNWLEHLVHTVNLSTWRSFIPPEQQGALRGTWFSLELLGMPVCKIRIRTCR